ncbi:MAG: patatin-like phospholipase family protein [Planctomycetes bacterium]|nr:patatin-like phospholipase family protein [Planctomycetota bacterium]
MPDMLDLRPGATRFSWAELSAIAGGDDKTVQASVVGKEMAKLFAKMREARGADYVPQAAAAFCRMLQAKVDASSMFSNDPDFRDDIIGAIAPIIERAFFAPEVADLSFRHLIQRANNGARELLAMLDGLERQAAQAATPQDGEPWPDIPQIGLSADGSVSVLQDKPKPETLVLKGGGCKGVGYVMTFKTLARENVLSEVRNVVGTSIGAITSAGLACGLSVTGDGRGPTDESELGTYLSDVCNTTADIDHLLSIPIPLIGSKPDAIAEFKNMYPHIDQMIPSIKGALEGWHVFRTIELTTARSVNQFLRGQGLPEGFPPEWNNPPDGIPLTPVERTRLRFLAEQDMTDVDPRVNQPEDRTGRMVTFRDLELLARLSPDKFKNLAITAYSGELQKSVFFDARTTPDLPVAVAARASMALPGVYSPVVIRYEGRERLFHDGGIGNNMPIDYGIRLTEAGMTDEEIRGVDAMEPDKSRALTVARSKVLALAFDDEGAAYTALHEPVNAAKISLKSIATNIAINAYTSVTAGQSHYDRTLRHDRERIHAHGARNTLIVPHDGVGLTSSEAMRNDAVRRGVYIASTANTLKFLDARENKGYQLNVDSEDFHRNAWTLARHIPQGRLAALQRRLREELEAFEVSHPAAADLEPAPLKERVRLFIQDMNAMSADQLRRFISFGPDGEAEARMVLARLWDATTTPMA